MRTTVLIFMIISSIGFSSCKKDNPKNFSAEDYIGTYSRSEDCGNGFSSVADDVVIGYGSAESEIIIQAFADGLAQDDMTGTVSGSTVALEGGSTCCNQNWSFTGTGTLSDDKTKLTINYTLTFQIDDDPEETYTCTSILTRK